MTLFEHLKLILAVTVVTALIWLYAEGENVRPYSVTASIQFVPLAGSDLIISPAQPQTVQVTVRCSSAKLAEVQRRLQSGAVNIKIGPDSRNPDGRQVVVLRDSLAHDSPLSKIHVNVIDVQPATLEAYVDTMSQVVLPVAVNTGDAQLAGTPTVNPKEVTLTVPSSVAAALRDAKIEARIDPQALAKLEVAVPHTLDVDLAPPAPLRMMTTQPALPRVKVTLTIRMLTQTIPLAQVPVRLDLAPADTARFAVTLSDDDRFLRDLSVTGPADVLERIRKHEIEIWASLRLTTEELEKAVAARAATPGTTGTALTKTPEIMSRPPLPSTVTIEPAPRPISYSVQAKP
ncbi:MAG: hypothetical protein K8S99_07315 [Planctomycetes bacterium]|nr:hypothetical protein [Planctomycetota bacterium]